jgi:hypothetical protein
MFEYMAIENPFVFGRAEDEVNPRSILSNFWGSLHFDMPSS